jgi:hypothetical protein
MTKRQVIMEELSDGKHHRLVGYFYETAKRMAQAGALNFSKDEGGNFLWKIRQKGELPTGAPMDWSEYCALVGPRTVLVVKMPEQSVRWRKVAAEAQAITMRYYHGERVIEFDGIDPKGCRNAALAFAGNAERYKQCDLFSWNQRTQSFVPVRIGGKYTTKEGK